MKIVLLSPLAHCSGNHTTIYRLRGHFERNGISCHLTSPESYNTKNEFSKYLRQTDCTVILAIHAYKSGWLLTGCKVPYILILGGTDVNECTNSPDKMKVMTEAIHTARYIVCFGSSLKDKFFEKWPLNKSEQVSIIPQAVEAIPSKFCIKKYILNNIQPWQSVLEPMNNILAEDSTVHFHKDFQDSDDQCNQSRRQEEESRRKLKPSLTQDMQSHDPQKERYDQTMKNQAVQSKQSHDESKSKSHDQKMLTHDKSEYSPGIIEDMLNIGRSDDISEQPNNLNERICKDGHPHDLCNSSDDIFQNGEHPQTDYSLQNGYCNDHHDHLSKETEFIRRGSCSRFEDALFFTMVGGIRAVKDPLYLVDKFSEWAERQEENCYLLIIGPKMEEEYFCQFKKKISSQQYVIYIPGLSLHDTHAAIRDSFVFVNTSLSEGMAVSILEAMSLETPVLARDIPGNRNIVNDGETGILFNTVQDFFAKADILMKKKEEVLRLTNNASRYISQNHTVHKEEEAYISLVQNICDSK